MAAIIDAAAGNLSLEGFVGRFILLHLNIPADETSGETGILTATTDGFGKFFLVHLHEDGLFLLVDGDGLDLGGLEGLGHEGLEVIAPADDVDFLVVQFTDDVLHSRSAKSDTGAYGIDFLVGAVDRHLGAVARFPGERTDLDSTVGDLAHLGLEKAADKIRMAARKDDLGTARTVLHSHDVGADTVTHVVFLGGDTLALVHDPLELTKIDVDIASLKPSHGATDDITSPILVFLVDHLLFRLAETLHHRLLRSLRGDTTEIRRRDVHLDFGTHVDTRASDGGP